MAEQPAEATEQATSPETEAKSPGRSMYIKAVVVVGVIVAIECGVVYLMVPSPEKAAAMVQEAVENDPPELAEPAPEEAKKSEDAAIEVDLDTFSVSAFQPATNTTLRIDFHLYGVTNSENESELLSLLEEHRHRISEQVLVTVRSAELSDLTDASLGLIKRRILEKVNKTLGKPLLERVIISEYSFIEQ